jgi:hypothetical protein
VDEPQDVAFEEPVDDADGELFGEQVDEPLDEQVEEPVDEGSDAPSGEPTSAHRSGYEATGNPEVDDVLESVSQVAELPTSEHVEVYEDAHRRLHETLVTAVDEPERPHGG